MGLVSALIGALIHAVANGLTRAHQMGEQLIATRTRLDAHIELGIAESARSEAQRSEVLKMLGEMRDQQSAILERLARIEAAAS